MRREVVMRVALETDADAWPSDENLHASVEGRLEGERLWDAYKPTQVTATECTVIEGDVALTFAEADALRAAVMGDRFDTIHIDSAIGKIERAEEHAENAP